MAAGGLTVKERILLHLFEYSRFAEEAEAPAEVTPSGIAKAAGVRTRSVPQHVTPLQTDGLVEERMRRVGRTARRRKTYFLTGPGQHQAASLRRSFLKKTVTFTRTTGQAKEVSLSTVYQEDRRGARLLELLGELASEGTIVEAPPPVSGQLVDHAKEAPAVEKLYGREEEFDEVLEALEQTPLVVVTGIAGIGKSALGAQVCEQARNERSLFWTRIRPWTAPTDLSRKLGRFLKATGRGSLDSYMTRSISKEMGRIEDALLTDLAGLAVLLVFDDVHIASEETLTFLSMLHAVLERSQGCSGLLLTREPPPFYSRRDVEMEGSVREVSLGALGRESSEALLRDGGVPELKVRDMSKVSGGSPLFLRVLMKARTGDEIRRGLDTFEAYIAEEIEPALSEEEREVLQAASLYEIPVPPRAFLQEARSGTGVILSLHRKGLLDRVGTRRFSLHDALRAYFHGGLPGEMRRSLAAKATPWLLDEAERCEKERDRPAALGCLENAVAIAPSREGRLRGLRRLGDLRFLSNDAVRAERAYRRAFTEVEEASERAMLHFKVGRVLEFQGRFDEAEEEADEGLGLLPSSPSLEAGWLLFLKAEQARWRHDYDGAVAGYEKVWNWLPNLPEDSALKATIIQWWGILKLFNPVERDPVSVKEFLKGAVEAARVESSRNPPSLDDPLWQSLGFTAQACLQMGEVEEALAYMDEGSAAADQFGAPIGHRWYLVIKGWCLAECLGQREAAHGMYQEAHRLERQVHVEASLRELWLYRNFADLFRSQSRYFEARESQEHFLLNCTDRVGVDSKVENLVYTVRLCVLCGDLEAARSHFEEANSLTHSSPSDTARFYLDWAQAVLWSGLGEEKEARNAFESALEIGPMCPWPGFSQEFLATMAYRGEFLLEYGRFLSSVGDTSLAEQILLQSKDEFKKLGRKPFLKEVERALQSLSADTRAKSNGGGIQRP